MKNSYSLLVWILVITAIFLPRLIRPDDFFIQDEQPWLDRSQLYINSLTRGDLVGAARYPLSNHPAIPLMTVVGPALNWYGGAHGLNGTYEGWSLTHRREAAVLGRWVWGIACSFVLLGVYAITRHLEISRRYPLLPAGLVILLGLEPWIWGISRSVSVDVLIGLALVGSFVTGALAREQKRWWQFSLAGAWWALAFVSKSPALIAGLFAFGLAILLLPKQWKEMLRRAGWWVLGAYIAMCVLWPPFIIHPFERITDVLARAELHATTPEQYLWPASYPPLLFLTLSTLATTGVLLYVVLRFVRPLAPHHRLFLFVDAILLAAITHEATLLYVAGDHPRKNLPALTLFAAVGIMGWLRLSSRLKLNHLVGVGILITLQLIATGYYFPHVISAHNILLSTSETKRLLVDIGNGSLVAADFINTLEPGVEVATSMDSLIQPYVDANHPNIIHELPRSGSFSELPTEVEFIIMPASFPARVEFDPTALAIIREMQHLRPYQTLSIRNVPMFYVYKRP